MTTSSDLKLGQQEITELAHKLLDYFETTKLTEEQIKQYRPVLEAMLAGESLYNSPKEKAIALVETKFQELYPTAEYPGIELAIVNTTVRGDEIQINCVIKMPGVNSRLTMPLFFNLNDLNEQVAQESIEEEMSRLLVGSSE